MRTIDSTIETALTSPAVRGIYLVRLHFDAGIVAWHSGFGTITFESTAYLGVGNLSSISIISEDVGIKASGVSVSLSGIKEEVVALLLNRFYINRKAYIHFVPLNESDQPVTANAYLLFRGSMEPATGTMGANASFTLPLKSRLADWERPRKVLYSDVEQQQLYPGDRGLEYVAQLSQKKLIWPRAAFLPDTRD